MIKDEFQKAVDDVIADCIRNDYSFGSYAYKVTEAVWPLLEAAEKSDAESIAMYRKARDERDALRAENAALVDDMNLLRNNNTALRSKIEAAENDDAHQKALADSALRVAEGWEEKCNSLRAKIEAMGRQEPSEQDASVRKAWARFSHELHRSPDAPYPGMADAFEQHFSQSFIDREWRAEAATWAAAWKAAKRHCVEYASVGEIADAVVDLIVKGKQEWTANTALLAAAPDLLDALRLIATAQERGFGIDYAKGCALAAIRRATGEQP